MSINILHDALNSKENGCNKTIHNIMSSLSLLQELNKNNPKRNKKNY